MEDRLYVALALVIALHVVRLCTTLTRDCGKALSIVKIIFYFWSFEIKDCILRTSKIVIRLDSFSKQI